MFLLLVCLFIVATAIGSYVAVGVAAQLLDSQGEQRAHQRLL
jgi:hypothetical protein